MNAKVTWQPLDPQTSTRRIKDIDLPDTAFAFPRHRKAPLASARQVEEAIVGFAAVKGVVADEREQAFVNIKAAAAHFGVDLPDRNWFELLRRSQDLATDAQKGGGLASSA